MGKRDREEKGVKDERKRPRERERDRQRLRLNGKGWKRKGEDLSGVFHLQQRNQQSPQQKKIMMMSTTTTMMTRVNFTNIFGAVFAPIDFFLCQKKDKKEKGVDKTAPIFTNFHIKDQKILLTY